MTRFQTIGEVTKGRARAALATAIAVSLGGMAFAHAQGEVTTLEVGSPAPAFAVTAHDGRAVDLAKQKGKFTVLYFYPRDNTPGCTREACRVKKSMPVLPASGPRTRRRPAPIS